MPIRFRYDPVKAAQAVGVLMRADGVNRMNYMRVLKLLYLADRQGLKTAGKPITGDRVHALPRGPVVNRTYDLIMDRDVDAPIWHRFFQTDYYDLCMVADPGVDQMSPFEIDTLKAVSKEHRDKDERALSDHTHRLPEYERNKPDAEHKSVPIPFEDIIEAVGRKKDVESIARDAEADWIAARIFG